MQTKEPKYKVHSFKISVETIKDIKIAAACLEITMTELLKNAIAEYLKKFKGRKE